MTMKELPMSEDESRRLIDWGTVAAEVLMDLPVTLQVTSSPISTSLSKVAETRVAVKITYEAASVVESLDWMLANDPDEAMRQVVYHTASRLRDELIEILEQARLRGLNEGVDE